MDFDPCNIPRYEFLEQLIIPRCFQTIANTSCSTSKSMPFHYILAETNRGLHLMQHITHINHYIVYAIFNLKQNKGTDEKQLVAKTNMYKLELKDKHWKEY